MTKSLRQRQDKNVHVRFVLAHTAIGVDLAGLLGGTHGERRRWVRVEWDGIWGGVSPLQPTKESGGAS